ncbi:MAG: sodium:proton antiporter NhaD [Saprospiraceae bacterium]|nr:sodium:proton antiporter NhaD [Lewinella sp.]
MYWSILVVFILGYLLIALEHPLKNDKTASALLTGVLCWMLLVMGRDTLLTHFPEAVASPEDSLGVIDRILVDKVGEIAEILFFLLGAMTIVELVDAYGGFRVITDRIQTKDRVKLLWLICGITFFFSALLDNLTTAIVMATLLRKLLKRQEDLYFFGGMVVVAANAGGAWSPIGDVTTIMLWISGQITTWHIVRSVFLPSVLCLLVPLLVLSRQLKGELYTSTEADPGADQEGVSTWEQNLVFWLGTAGLLFVPVFKNLYHLPPFMGMLLSLSILWIVTGILHHRRTNDNQRPELTVAEVIHRIDTPSILFFLGILLAVAALETAGHLEQLAQVLNEQFGNIYLVNTFIGLLSAVVDNVPLVAGAIGMYPLDVYPQDATFWQLLAYCAGTGGSILIIGSAAGVAIMGLLRINFIWYLKKISWLALLGYLSGVLLLYLMNGVF